MSDTVATWDAIKRMEEAHAALDSKFERLMQHFVTMDERVTDFMVDCQQQSIAALESPAASAPDPVCQCGHPLRTHEDGEWCCTRCQCLGYVPTADPEPAPLDPVLVAEVADILRHAAIQSLDCHSTAECVVVAIRAYGRDGAR